MPLTSQIVYAGYDPTGVSSITGAQLLQLVQGATLFDDKGMLVTTLDSGVTPQPPDGNSNPSWQNCIWRRIDVSAKVYLYYWDNSITDDATFLKWVSINSNNLPVNSVGTAQLQQRAVTSEKIAEVDWSLITNFPTTMGGDLTGEYPNPVVGANKIGTSKIAPGSITLSLCASDLTAAIVGNSTPSGIITPFGGTAAPDGWLECNGGAVKQADYPDLYSAIQIVYASGILWGWPCDSGGTQDAAGIYFKLPDFRGYFLRGWSHGAAEDSGRSNRTVQANANKAHTHNPGTLAITPSGALGIATGTGQLSAGGSKTFTAALGITGATASDGGTEARPDNISCMYIIKT